MARITSIHSCLGALNAISLFALCVCVGVGVGIGTGCDTNQLKPIVVMETDTQSDPDTDSNNDSAPVDPVDTDTFTTETVFGLLGYATVDDLGQNGTTGGQGDPTPVTVTTAAALQEAIDNKDAGPLTIYVSGTLTHTEGRILISNASDISIIGIGSDAELDSVGISIDESSNIVVQNLTIHHVSTADQDGIRISNQSHHIWIDHCHFYNDPATVGSDTIFDSLLDISHASAYITVSWCHFRHHVKGIYVGHSDNNSEEDTGSLRTTWHHNIFSNISSHVLSFRFGESHVFNNRFEAIQYTGDGTGLGVSSRMGACVRIENNQFLDVNEPVVTDQSGDDLDHYGAVQLIVNDFGNYSVLAQAPTCELTPPYEYISSLNPPSSLTEILGLNTGTGFDTP